MRYVLYVVVLWRHKLISAAGDTLNFADKYKSSCLLRAKCKLVTKYVLPKKQKSLRKSRTFLQPSDGGCFLLPYRLVANIRFNRFAMQCEYTAILNNIRVKDCLLPAVVLFRTIIFICDMAFCKGEVYKVDLYD